MAAKIVKKRSKQRRPNAPKAKEAPPSSAAAIGAPTKKEGHPPPPSIDGAYHTPNANAPSTDGANPTSKANALVSQLHEHDDQGRIFDALSVVRELEALERDDPSISRELEPVRHLMEETVEQSAHVESLLHELHSDDDWTLAKQKSGVTVHFRREEASPIHTVRACTTFDNFQPKDFVRLCSLFVETECMHLWFPGGIMKPANLLSWHSKYTKVIQLRISLGLPMVSPRDAIVLGNGYHLPDRNAFLISTKTILEDTFRYCDIPPPEKGVVRMATESIFYVELVQSDVISFKMIGRDDLKFKYMPSSLLNYLSQGHLPFDLMKTIHRTIRNFQGSVWEEKIEERGAYYTEIEDKVYEQLEKWEAGGWGASLRMPVEEERSSVRKVKFDLPRTTFATPPRHHVEVKGRKNVFVADDTQGQWSSRHIIALVVPAVMPLVAYIYPEGTFEALAMLNDSPEIMRTIAFLVTVAVLAVFASAIKRTKQQPAKVKSILVKSEGRSKGVKGGGGDEPRDLAEKRAQDCHTGGINGVAKPSPQSHPQVDVGLHHPKTSAQPPPVSRKRLKKVRSTLNAGLQSMKSVSSLQVVPGKRNGRKRAYTK